MLLVVFYTDCWVCTLSLFPLILVIYDWFITLFSRSRIRSSRECFCSFILSLIMALRFSWESRAHSCFLKSLPRWLYRCSWLSKCWQGMISVHSGHRSLESISAFKLEAAFLSLWNLSYSRRSSICSLLRWVILIIFERSTSLGVKTKLCLVPAGASKSALSL